MSGNTSTISPKNNFPPQIADDSGVFYCSTDPDTMPETDIHFKIIANLVLILEIYLLNQPDANVFGDLMFYYEKGNPRKFVAPDVMVCFGIDKTPRRVFKLWEENSAPAIIIEIASENTWSADLTKKFALYQELGVQEYYVFDPEYKNLRQPLLAFHLSDGELAEVEIEQGKVFSKILGLELVDTGETLRLFNPETKGFLMTMEEMAKKLNELESK
jgi:Uma2 family endonuclease